MDTRMIKDLWRHTQCDRQATVALWDSVAQDYGSPVLPTPADSAALALMEKTGMLPANASVLSPIQRFLKQTGTMFRFVKWDGKTV